MKIFSPIVIHVNFSKAVYSGTEEDGTIMITVEANGFSIWPFSVVVTPMEIGGPGNFVSIVWMLLVA